MAFRAFVGVPIGPLPPLVELVGLLARSGADVKVVEPEKLHVTLAFLGEVPDDAPARLAPALDAATRAFRPFTVRLRGAGAFPNERRPRVAWVGIDEPKPLVDLATAVRAALHASGASFDEKAFRAHVTIARARGDRGDDALATFLREHATDELGECRVEDVRLYKSTLGPRGATHEPIHVAKLEA